MHAPPYNEPYREPPREPLREPYRAETERPHDHRLHDSRHDPLHDRPHEASHDRTHEPARARSSFESVMRSPRGRPLLLAAGALLLLLLMMVVYYGDPANRARRELSAANERIAEKQREVDDARRLLERRLVELRAVRAQADVQATVYRGVLEREGRPVRDTTVVGGEVALPPVAPSADPNLPNGTLPPATLPPAERLP
jgi:hypothetical protein